MDRTTWQFINSFSSWLSAIGTVAAVIVALYLARRDKRIRLQVSAGIRLIVTQGIKGKHPDFLTIRVTNIGHREAQLTNIGWKVGFFRKKHAVQTTMRDGISSDLPVRLKDGEEASYYIPLDNRNINWMEDFVKDFMSKYPTIISRSIKIIADTSVGTKFESRIEKGLRDRLVKVAKKSFSSNIGVQGTAKNTRRP